ncbi:MAG: hypothetical protein M1827_000797 [Pycnora praestabilis]|nr:MAG: hypothetical protein M1827_000797 [Pycnora praestabilis]
MKSTPPPINVEHFHRRDIGSSPYSWGSQDSNKGLMASPSPPAVDRSVSQTNSPPVPRHAQFQASTMMSQPSTPSLINQLRSEQNGSYVSLPMSSTNAGGRSSIPFEDEDAKVVMKSVSANRATARQSTGDAESPNALMEGFRERNSMPTTDRQSPTSSGPRRQSSAALFDSDDSEFVQSSNGWAAESTQTTPRAKRSDLRRESTEQLYASGRAGPAKVPARTGHYEGSQLQQETRNKVMTPAQFERYRQEQEMSRNKHEVVASDESEEDEDDEDEAERNRQLAKERRKQEAHLAVYRQQMMKVTGEQPGTSHMHLGLERAAVSTPNLANGVGKQSDDEDEDVPLGILAAHGFPNKNRPPTQLLSVNSSPDLTANGQMGAHPPAPGSMGGESAAGGARKSLPVFARNLPQDPYFGASLVNPPNRESLAFGNNGGGSVHGGGQSGLPPGGLVGVIAGEERARAARRGSPNAQGGYPVYGMPQMHQQTPGLGRNMGPLAGSPMGMGISGANGVPGMQLMMTPGDQAQVQMSQQMTQMMQMQMQWMQQMMQMQGMQNGQHIQQQLPLHQQSMMPNNPPMPPGQLQRPVTMGSNSAPTTYGTPHVHQRTMSMLDPGMSQRNQQNFSGSSYASSNHLQAPGNQAYAASIAPSERSNIGMPPRYRPVSIAPNAEINNKSSRASTLTAGTMQTLNEVRGGAAMNKAIDPRRANGTGSDDDDEEGWERMKEKRDRKKSTWKLKRGSSGLQDMFYAGSEGM